MAYLNVADHWVNNGKELILPDPTGGVVVIDWDYVLGTTITYRGEVIFN